jgi:outer membrane protein assembly factor BamB
MRPTLLTLLLLVAAASNASAENWPQFRGPTGMGIVAETGLPTTWGGAAGENILWKSPLPGAAPDEKTKLDHNQSSPIVWGDRIFLTASYWPEGRQQSDPPEHHVACYRAADGMRLWDTTVDPGPWKLTDLRGGYSAPTPATDGQRVYVLFGSAVLAALDVEGKPVWRQELPDYQAFDVAIAASPIVYRGSVILLADKNNQKGVLTAYDTRTGTVQWEQKRPGVAFAHSTPTIAEIGGRPQLLVSASNALQGLDPASGEVQWWVKTPGDVCSPVFADGIVFADTGRGGPGVFVEPSGTGDLTATGVKGKVAQIPEGLSSPVIAAGHVYRLHNPAILKCFDLHTGMEAFATRLDGVAVPSSPIATPEGNVYFGSSGKSFVIKAGPKYELVATNDLNDPSSASVAVSGGKLLFKGRHFLTCVGKKQ